MWRRSVNISEFESSTSTRSTSSTSSVSKGSSSSARIGRQVHPKPAPPNAAAVTEGVQSQPHSFLRDYPVTVPPPEASEDDFIHVYPVVKEAWLRRRLPAPQVRHTFFEMWFMCLVTLAVLVIPIGLILVPYIGYRSPVIQREVAWIQGRATPNPWINVSENCLRKVDLTDNIHELRTNDGHPATPPSKDGKIFCLYNNSRFRKTLRWDYLPKHIPFALCPHVVYWSMGIEGANVVSRVPEFDVRYGIWAIKHTSVKYLQGTKRTSKILATPVSSARMPVTKATSCVICRPSFGGSCWDTAALPTGERSDEKPHKRNTVRMALRCVQYADFPVDGLSPTPPTASVRKTFFFCPGRLDLEAALDKETYNQGDMVRIHVTLSNGSSKTVQRLKVAVLQHVHVCMFTHGRFKNLIGSSDTGPSRPVPPGSTVSRDFDIKLQSCEKFPVALAIESEFHEEDSAVYSLSSTTVLVNPKEKNPYGVNVSYEVKVKAILGCIDRPLVVRLPFRVMLPRPPEGVRRPTLPSSKTSLKVEDSLDPITDCVSEDIARLGVSSSPHEVDEVS
ncbi:putative arrestin [Ixodes scapularis]